MRRGAFARALLVAIMGSGVGACDGGKGTEAARPPSGAPAASSTRSRGGALDIPTTTPQTVNTPVSVPGEVIGVAVTIPPRAPCTVVGTIANETLGFARRSHAVSAEGRTVLSAFVKAVLKNPRLVTVEVTGFASSEGDERYNLALSERRAAAVAAELSEDERVKSVPIRALGKGEADPVADNSTEEGHQANRRVELAFRFEGCK